MEPTRASERAWVGWTAIATLAFARPLTNLLRHASEGELHSYIPLVPLVSAYLLYTARGERNARPAPAPAMAAALMAVSLALAFAATRWDVTLSGNDALSLYACAYVGVIAAGGFLVMGTAWMRAAAFPIAFLLFLAPLPDAAVTWIENASVLASADVAALFLRVSGMPFLREGTLFALPTITIRVAQECSGIRSSWILFITSLLVSRLFLRGMWRRAALVAFIIPLGIVRNGFRILVIALLCVYAGPEMIDSPIHHQGGPIFFALSLIPLFAVVVWLRRQEKRRT